MPCYDSRDSAEYVRSEYKAKVAFLEAAACMLSRHIGRDGECMAQVAEKIDDSSYLSAGITKQEFSQWLQEHEAKDQRK